MYGDASCRDLNIHPKRFLRLHAGDAEVAVGAKTVGRSTTASVSGDAVHAVGSDMLVTKSANKQTILGSPSIWRKTVEVEGLFELVGTRQSECSLLVTRPPFPKSQVGSKSTLEYADRECLSTP